VHLLNILKIEIKYKIILIKILFYTFNILNTQVSKQNVIIYMCLTSAPSVLFRIFQKLIASVVQFFLKKIIEENTY
jgi:hypothetical protein